ncbi:protein-ER retention protein [Arthrobotrys musiformis]|uniref:Protein-ER retention protein n=1 Tax=Arthrobotrys musiformis TaxID=47236 RepID=A0AAV9WIR0_9PEZI
MGDEFAEVELQDGKLLLWLPLPYRVLILMIAGVWAWGLNLQYLYSLRIDVAGLIKYTRGSPDKPMHTSVYRVASILSAMLAVNLMIFWRYTSFDTESVRKWEMLPGLLLLGIMITFVLPFDVLHRDGRYRLLKNFRRIAFGYIDREQRFSDLLLADVLTSYAKVLGDIWICSCMFFTGISSTSMPERQCGGTYMLPIIIAIPSAIRLRQCLIEYSRNIGRPGSERKPHMYNAMKYASAFPVILFSALQKDTDAGSTGLTGEAALYRLWLLSVLVNSGFSFYWDVARDWDLSLFSPSRSNPEHPFGLRQVMIFPVPGVYYAAIFLDGLLRLTWSLKLSPHLDRYGDLELGIFILQFLEIFRRWLWIFFRVETEWTRTETRLGGDILLGEYPYKSDSD